MGLKIQVVKSFIRSTESCLLQLAYETLDFVVLDLYELFHLLNFELKNLNYQNSTSTVLLSSLMAVSFSVSTSLKSWFFTNFEKLLSLFGLLSSPSGLFFLSINPLILFCVTLSTRSMMSGVQVMMCSMSFLLIWQLSFFNTFSLLHPSYCSKCSSCRVWWSLMSMPHSCAAQPTWGNNERLFLPSSLSTNIPTCVCEVTGDILLGTRERHLIHPIVHFRQLLLVQGRSIHL